MKFGSILYFRSNRSNQRSKMFMGTTIIPWLEASPEEKDVMYWKRSNAILWAKANRSSTPEETSSRFLMVSSLSKKRESVDHQDLIMKTYGSNDTPSCTTGHPFTSSLVAQPVRKIPEGFDGSTDPSKTQF